jgi:hypothetical protein
MIADIHTPYEQSSGHPDNEREVVGAALTDGDVEAVAILLDDETPTAEVEEARVLDEVGGAAEGGVLAGDADVEED